MLLALLLLLLLAVLPPAEKVKGIERIPSASTGKWPVSKRVVPISIRITSLTTLLSAIGIPSGRFLIGCAAVLLCADLLVGGVNLLHFLFRFLISRMKVGMILLRQLAVCLCDFILGSGRADAQYLIGVRHINQPFLFF